MIADIKVPDSDVVRQAEELARTVSSDTLFNHVMRSYWFGELFAQSENSKVDSELIFLSAVLHDLGLTDHAPGPHRYEVEGAGAAQRFLASSGVSEDRAQKVWDNIALHTSDLNFFRTDTSRIMQLGIMHDVVGVPDAKLDPNDVAEVLRRYPRLDFTRSFYRTLEHELESKRPYPHDFHPCTRIALARSPLKVDDLSVWQSKAPFDE